MDTKHEWQIAVVLDWQRSFVNEFDSIRHHILARGHVVRNINGALTQKAERTQKIPLTTVYLLVHSNHS